MSAFLVRFRRHLRDRRFWVIQALVIAVTASHAVVEELQVLVGHELGAAYFVPASLYFIPVVYASLNFGREGAVPTAIWSAVLAVPNVFIWHEGLERAGEATLIVIMIVLAIIVAGRVDRETAARLRAEAEGSARRISEGKYRGLFESAGDAILVLDADGTIGEANAAAEALFGRPSASLRGVNVVELLGPDGAGRILRLARGEQPPAGELMVGVGGGAPVWVEPVCSSFTDGSGAVVVQALLRDVTARRERQRGLESYAQLMLRAQEDERLRIAREIHDGPVQALVQVCRQLDALEEGSPPGGGGDTGPAIRGVRELAEGVADELRRFSGDLRPSILDDLGLVPAVRRLLKDLEARTGVTGTLEVEGSRRRVHPDIELCLFRMAQEALRNVERHARASRADVTLAYEEGRVRLSVVDDGRGFRPATTGAGQPASADRFGLLGMQERGRLLGGEFRVASTPGKGTSVEVTIPAPG